MARKNKRKRQKKKKTLRHAYMTTPWDHACHPCILFAAGTTFIYVQLGILFETSSLIWVEKVVSQKKKDHLSVPHF
jgi:hypothetical protein